MAIPLKEGPSREELDMEFWFSTISPRVLWAVRSVDRKFFLPKGRRAESYIDNAVNFGEGCSLSQPSLVAQMVDQLRLTGDEKVLEVGTGRGYEAAILSLCAREVYTIEYNPKLVRGAQRRLGLLGFNNAHVVEGDGCLGLPEYAPYEAIVVSAAAKEIPDALIDQLVEFGRIVIPVGPVPDFANLVVGVKLPKRLAIKAVKEVNFHPLMSTEQGGWTKEVLEELVQKKIAFVLRLAEKEAGEEGIPVDDLLKRVCSLAEVTATDGDARLRQIVDKIRVPPEELIEGATTP